MVLNARTASIDYETSDPERLRRQLAQRDRDVDAALRSAFSQAVSVQRSTWLIEGAALASGALFELVKSSGPASHRVDSNRIRLPGGDYRVTVNLRATSDSATDGIAIGWELLSGDSVELGSFARRPSTNTSHSVCSSGGREMTILSTDEIALAVVSSAGLVTVSEGSYSLLTIEAIG